MYFVYILYSVKFNRYYIGYTENIALRVVQHNAGHTKSTKPFRPWILVHQEILATKMEARKRENQIKRYKRGEAFYKLVNHGWLPK